MSLLGDYEGYVEQTVPLGYSYDASQPGGLVQLPQPTAKYRALFPGTYPAPNTPPPYGISPPVGSTADFSAPLQSDGGTVRITPDATPAPTTPNGWTNSYQPNGRGYFYNSETGRFEFKNYDGPVKQGAPPNTPGMVNPMGPSGAASQALNWIEEIGIRALMVLVGIVLVASGFYIAGQRIPKAVTVRQLGKSVL